jgi:hypothetical protein
VRYSHLNGENWQNIHPKTRRKDVHEYDGVSWLKSLVKLCLIWKWMLRISFSYEIGEIRFMNFFAWHYVTNLMLGTKVSEENISLFSTLKMEAVVPSVFFIPTYQETGCHKPEQYGISSFVKTSTFLTSLKLSHKDLTAVIMKCTLFLTVTSCSLVPTFRRTVLSQKSREIFSKEQAASIALVSLTLRPWIWRQYILPKCLLRPVRLYGVISQKIEYSSKPAKIR